MESVFVRSMTSVVTPPACPNAQCKKSNPMRRAISKFAQQFDLETKLAEAEAKYGKEVDGAMGPEPDIGKYVRRYDRLAKDLPPPEHLGT